MEENGNQINEALDGGNRIERILFIDDNKLVLKTVGHLLENTAWELVAEENVFDGLCALVERKPLRIFVDAGSGRLNGFQFCHLVKKLPRFRHIPLIIVLEQHDPMQQAKAEAAGANAVLVKPFGKTEFMNLVNNGLARVA